ncbi:MAG: cytochrome c3 family protein [Anaerolineales bacterium]|nr:cytochrome c3 family protein [Anaerolineales bacterium]
MQKIKLPALAAGLIASALAVSWALLVLIVSVRPAQADGLAQETEKYCLSCHGNPDLKMTLPSGEQVSLYISAEDLQHSVHSPAGIECEACHTEIKTYPHPPITYTTRREMARTYYLACQKCHSSNYAKTQDSMHAQAAAAGNLDAPVCTDCHGAHNVRPPDEPRALISTTCGKCHTQINQDYVQSVHGGDLLTQDNPDVPVCTDCHGVHNIQDPRTAQFRVETPDLCARCHADAERMSKYGLSADVYGLYNLSWHGVDVAVYKAKWPTIWHESAVCTDCHGIHNIRRTSDPASKVNPANLLATCQECHPGVGANWTAAWIGHNRIDPQRTPFLYYTEVFYRSLTPIVLWASILYVALQILHAAMERVRRSLP